MTDYSDAPIRCDLDAELPAPEAATIVLFGGTGDLARRKIVPALYELDRDGLLHPGSRVLGIGRSPLGSEAWIAGLREACREKCRRLFDPLAWDGFARRCAYLEGDLGDAGLYRRLAGLLAASAYPANRLFYLAVSPEQFAPVARGLAEADLGSAGGARPGWSRLLVEKPFGRDRASAGTLNRELQASFAERDIFRIDHYLGKETVQNLLYFRFANSIFEPLWNRGYIERVEIDVLEEEGIGTRGGYYDGAGAARDMLQNHLVQLLCLVAMEPPVSLDPESIRDEKVKVLKSIPAYAPTELLLRSRRGQYGEGADREGRPLRAYREEAKVAPGSGTETFAALRLEVDNWRFAGVPFVLRTGKALDRRESEIRIRFHRPPATLFAGDCGERLAPNLLRLRIQPDEKLELSFNVKVPGRASVEREDLRFSYREKAASLPEAYERLLADALAGDSTLFIRADEAEAAWTLVDRLEEAWASPEAPPLLIYPAGSPPPPMP
jgi:glucose-6-phosphate 1-dehydrogenase